MYPPWWLPFPLIAGLVAVGTILSRERAVRVVVAAVVGTFAGTTSGFVIWQPKDAIAATYVGPIIAVDTLATLVVAVVTFLLFKKSGVDGTSDPQPVANSGFLSRGRPAGAHCDASHPCASHIEQ